MKLARIESLTATAMGLDTKASIIAAINVGFLALITVGGCPATTQVKVLSILAGLYAALSLFSSLAVIFPRAVTWPAVGVELQQNIEQATSIETGMRNMYVRKEGWFMFSFVLACAASFVTIARIAITLAA
jgi:hypothetical protein